MRRLERNSAFFQLVQEAESAAGQGGLSRLFKTAKESGKLNLSGRALSAIPDTAFALATTLDEGGKFWEVNPLTRLDLSSNELKDIPEGKFQLINNDLAYLNLKNNKLHSIPEDLFSCLQLKYLDLSTNGLTIITDSIGVLIELKELMLSENKLVAVPDTLHYCAVLQTLELQNNYLTKIPLATLVLPHLLNLNLSSNKLTEIPASISGLKLLGTVLCFTYF